MVTDSIHWMSTLTGCTSQNMNVWTWVWASMNSHEDPSMHIRTRIHGHGHGHGREAKAHTWSSWHKVMDMIMKLWSPSYEHDNEDFIMKFIIASIIDDQWTWTYEQCTLSMNVQWTANVQWTMHIEVQWLNMSMSMKQRTIQIEHEHEHDPWNNEQCTLNMSTNIGIEHEATNMKLWSSYDEHWIWTWM